jgi:NOL1/NOP2/fmu family ribosome biogenesis protein
VKLRFQSNSIRLRLKRGEVAQLAKTFCVEESIVIGTKETFQYRLEASRDVETLQVQLKAGRLVIQVPAEMARRWVEGNDVGIEATLSADRDQPLHVLIEKDFACLHGPSEKNVDTFPHPLAETGAEA